MEQFFFTLFPKKHRGCVPGGSDRTSYYSTITSTHSKYLLTVYKITSKHIEIGNFKKIFRFKKITSTHTVIIVQLPRHIVSTYLLTVYKKLP